LGTPAAAAPFYRAYLSHLRRVITPHELTPVMGVAHSKVADAYKYATERERGSAHAYMSIFVCVRERGAAHYDSRHMQICSNRE
jgi:hypothetical protein